MGDLSENFDLDEFECKCGCGFDTVDQELVDILEEIRSHFKTMYGGRVRVKVNSGCRCPDHNLSVGGSQSSQHLLGTAADI